MMEQMRVDEMAEKKAEMKVVKSDAWMVEMKDVMKVEMLVVWSAENLALKMADDWVENLVTR